jgi:CheY-like chemotaxis protein
MPRHYSDKLTLRVSIIPGSSRKRKPETVALHKDEKATVIRRGTVSIEVIDEGVGMSPEQVKTVFNDGTQFNANQFQAGGGSGLGLNIAQGIVIEHGGKLSCTSPGIGLGTTFALSLPVYDPVYPSPHSPEMPVVDVSKDSVTKETDSDFVVPKLFILVVDDSLTNRKLCIRLLERNGHTCEGACDGEEAVAMVKKSLSCSGKPYDCILLDYEMPKMNGPEACQRMRQMGCSSYIAGVTGNLMSEDVDHFRMCGANWVFPKPFRLEALEEQWIEDGVTPSNTHEGNGMVRVESGGHLEGLSDGVDQVYLA